MLLFNLFATCHPARRAAVVTMAHGLYAVDYRVLGLKMSTAEAWRAHGFDAVRL